jgi:hypothetical protein
MKIKAIKLAYFEEYSLGKVQRRVHVVISVKNSTEFNPGQEMTVREVTELCDNPTWDVTRIPNSPVGEKVS